MEPKRILVVDDDAHTCTYLHELLTSFGYGAETVLSCQEARQRITQGKYDLYLLDIWLEDGRGDDVLSWLRQQGHQQPVVMISGMADYDVWIDLVNKGAFDLVAKPIQHAQLRRVLDNAFNRTPPPIKCNKTDTSAGTNDINKR